MTKYGFYKLIITPMCRLCLVNSLTSSVNCSHLSPPALALCTSQKNASFQTNANYKLHIPSPEINLNLHLKYRTKVQNRHRIHMHNIQLQHLRVGKLSSNFVGYKDIDKKTNSNSYSNS